MATTPDAVREAKRKLTLFNEKVLALHRREFKKQVFIEDHGFTLKFTKESGTIEKRGANEESTLAITTPLRFFVQLKDGISFKQMGELYETLSVSDQDRDDVRKAVVEYEKYMAGLTPLVFDGEKVSNLRLFELFMYGSMAHANPDKAEVFDKWIGTSPFRTMYETLFEEIVADLIRLASWFYDVNERALLQLEPAAPQATAYRVAASLSLRTAAIHSVP